ncbi:MAG: hypothetical protein J6Z18_07985 [Prevotella sp.]|nr:hypothetical protein [Prevotella sp.]
MAKVNGTPLLVCSKKIVNSMNPDIDGKYYYKAVILSTLNLNDPAEYIATLFSKRVNKLTGVAIEIRVGTGTRKLALGNHRMERTLPVVVPVLKHSGQTWSLSLQVNNELMARRTCRAGFILTRKRWMLKGQNLNH